MYFEARPQCGFNSALKLKVTDTVQQHFRYCFSLCVNFQFVKLDIVTTIIYRYITADFHYAKCDSCLSAYGGVMLQRVFIEKNVNRHFSLNFTKFCNKNNWPQSLVVFFIVISCFSASRNLLSDLTLSEFPLLLKKSKSYILDSEVTPPRSEKKTLKACQLPKFLHRIIVQG